MRKIVVASFFLFYIFGSALYANQLKIVFRYDDFTLRNDLLNENVVRMFHKHHIPLVLGVIPCNNNEDINLQPNYSFLSKLKVSVQSGYVEVALHGLNHTKQANGEFGALTIEEQYRRMSKGKNILDSIFESKITTTFIPPWNAYDSNTLKVMQKLGFNSISSALCIGQSWTNSRISYYPETIEDFGTLLSVLEHNKNRDGVVVVMFHRYTFKKIFTLAQLDSLLTKINKLSCQKCVTFNQLNKEKEVSDISRMHANMESNLMSKQLHLNGVIQTTTFAIFVRILNVILYLCLSVLFYYLATLIFFRNKLIANNRKYSIGCILLLFVGLCVWFHLLAPLKLVLFVIIISNCASVVSKIEFKK